ncbi:MAG: hypothetical protein CMP09_23165 [Yangia sp.]|nr:hypothetical protein [Salipiger sp.]
MRIIELPAPQPSSTAPRIAMGAPQSRQQAMIESIAVMPASHASRALKNMKLSVRTLAIT